MGVAAGDEIRVRRVPAGRYDRRIIPAQRDRLVGSDCAFYGSDVELLLENRVRYPDGQVVRGPHPPDATFATTPVVIFEVTSPSSSEFDRRTKREEYTRLVTLRQYVIVEQHTMEVRLLEREGAGWTDRTLRPDDQLPLRAINVELPVSELYAGVDFGDG